MHIRFLSFKPTAIASVISFVLLLASQAQAAEDVIFSDVTLPLDDETAVTVSDEVAVGDEPAQPIGFTELFRTGQQDNGEVYGLMNDNQGNPAVSGTGVPYICSGNTSGVEGSGTAFNALLEKHGRTYLISQFGC